MHKPPEKFGGDLSSLWRLNVLPPLRRLSWWWWWWLVVIPDPNDPNKCRQLMVLWSTKDAPKVRVNDYDWMPEGRFHIDQDGGHTLPGMVCAWWYDGEEMYEPYLIREARIAALDSEHPMWPGSGEFPGAGAVVPVTEDDLSMGLSDDGSHFWIHCKGGSDAIADGAPKKFEFRITPLTEAASSAAYSNNVFGKGMGYDIIRLHACSAEGLVDEEAVQGTAYFQKVTVQAPSVPWFWGFLHFSDGTYLDWFIPHASFSMTARDERAWKLRDVIRAPLRTAGLLHDEKRGRSEKFERCEVELLLPEDGEFDSHGTHLPRFKIRLWNGRTQIGIQVRAVSRAHWTFDQPTRAGLVSHLTYNEYPLNVEEITILDEKGIRTHDDFEWIHGNAEHAWGLLH
ncbi:MAG: hypothetical protein QF440_05695 [Candidatus Thalassarchaeaceae archaeon]|nr:hypothetical protein [Candidatus Thalassarchaeaceae archaeon]